jgi:dihydroorotate dehydrogenase
VDLYTRLIRPLLFRLSADRANNLSHEALRWPILWQLLGSRPDLDPRLAVQLHGVPLPNPVGLAPGFDKDGDLLASLQHLGFGFLSPGSIMGEARAGNRTPRLGRLVEQQAVLNCMGLPSKGREHAVANLEARRLRVPVFACIQGTSLEQFVDSVLAVQPHAAALELSLACPNTRDTDRNKGLMAVIEIIHAIARVRQRPVFCKIPHEFHGERHDQLPALLDGCLDAGIEGVVASATGRHKTPQLSMGVGSVAGKPIFRDTLALVREIAAHAGGRLSIIAAGGVFTGRDAYEMLSAGASAVQIYSAMIYRGWMVPTLINRELLTVLDAEGFASVQALVDRSRLAAALA